MLTSKQFWLAAGERAIKTFAQTLVALVGTGAVGITQVNWIADLEVGGTAAILSLLTSLASVAPITDTAKPAPATIVNPAVGEPLPPVPPSAV